MTYGWNKDDVLQLTHAEINKLYGIISKRARTVNAHQRRLDK